MVVETKKSEAISQCCEANDLVGRKSGILLWCLPTLAILVGLNWNAARPWLWIPALLVMGIGCVVNARRCGRLHCYITGPIFLLGAIYVILAEANIVLLRPNIFVTSTIRSGVW
jgi:hypothetical protein